MLVCLGPLLQTSYRALKTSSVHLVRAHPSGCSGPLHAQPFSRSTALGVSKKFRKQARQKKREEKALDEEYHNHESKQESSSSPGVPASAIWIDSLEPFLPPHLRSSSYVGDGPSLGGKEVCHGVKKLLTRARDNDAGVDMLATLAVHHGRWSAFMFIVETLVTDATIDQTHIPSAEMPSNLPWTSSQPLEEMTKRSICFEGNDFSNGIFSPDTDLSLEPRPTPREAGEGINLLDHIWYSLGSIILTATSQSSKQPSQCLSHVCEVLERLHQLGLVSDQVYRQLHDSQSPEFGLLPSLHSSGQAPINASDLSVPDRPSDMHTTNLDNDGTKAPIPQSIFPSSPAGLKVVQSEAKTLLEIVLWCCVDSGSVAASIWIVDRMRMKDLELPRSTSPFEATGVDTIFDPKSAVQTSDQARVNREAIATTENDDRNLPVELLTALIEGSMNFTSPAGLGQDLLHQSQVLKSIRGLVSSMDHPGLAQGYLDYATVRLLRLFWSDVEDSLVALDELVESLRDLHSVDTDRQGKQGSLSLEVETILSQSQAYVGVLHQTLETYAIKGRVAPTLKVFVQIQELVDQSKLRSVVSFVDTSEHHYLGPPIPAEPFFGQEYTSTHGQLPDEELALLLDTALDGGLLQFGKWLLYSMDVDGPLIPLSLYSRSALMPSILRFALATRDHILMQDVEHEMLQKPLDPSVLYLRSLSEARIHIKDFHRASESFAALNEAKGGGTNLSNIANLVALILRSEVAAQHAWKERRHRLLSPGLSLLDRLLSGDFSGMAGDFRQSRIKEYRRELHGLLRIVETIPDTALSPVARSWVEKFGDSNSAALPSKVFDTIVAAVVETKGTKVAMMLWDLFCERPRQAEVDFRPILTGTEVLPLAATPMETRSVAARFRSSEMLEKASRQDTSDLPSVPMSNLSLKTPDVMSNIIMQPNLGLDGGSKTTFTQRLPYAVVKPTFRTLRIVVRSALDELEMVKKLVYMEDSEMQSPNVTGEPSMANMRILEAAMTDIRLVEDWAKPLLRRFGLSNEDVAAEFDWQLGEDGQIFSTTELQERFAAARTEYQLATLGLLARASEVRIKRQFRERIPIRKTASKVMHDNLREFTFHHSQKMHRKGGHAV